MKNLFPIFRKNKNIAYLDSAAMAQKPEVVILAQEKFYREYCANAHRGIYPWAEKATEEYEKARDKVANFIGAKSSEIIFLRNATEGINLLARGLSLPKKPTIVLTEMEHHSNLVPWQKLIKREKGSLRFIPATKDGLLDLSGLDQLLEGAFLVSLAWVSNVFGTINPVKEIVKRAKSKGALVIIDAAQAVSHFRINVSSLGADALAFSGYKIGGPAGVGVLWAKEQILDKLEPLNYGGHMVSSVEFNRASFKDAPWKFEAGTQDIASIIGLGGAVDFLIGQDWKQMEAKEKNLTKYLLDRLTAIPGVNIFGSQKPKARIGLASFNVEGAHPHDVAAILGELGVCVRAGHHCAEPLHKKFGLTGSVRASLWWYNDERDIDKLGKGLLEVKRIFS